MQDREDFALRAVHDWDAALPTLNVSADELSAAIRLSRIASLQDRIDTKTLRQFERQGIRGSDDFRVLALLRRSEDGRTNSELIEQLGGSKAGMSARLDRFIAHQIAERTPSTVDRRSHTNSLTDHGRLLADEVVAAVVRARHLLFADLSPAQVKSFADLLATIIESIDPHD